MRVATRHRFRLRFPGYTGRLEDWLNTLSDSFQTSSPRGQHVKSQGASTEWLYILKLIVVLSENMNKARTILTLVAIMLLTGSVFAQDKVNGGIKGKVRVETGTPADVAVVVRQGEQEVARSVTDRKGEFVVSRLAPGRYGLTFRKPGLTVGTIENVEVKAGKTRSLGDNLILSIDEGSIAFIRGSVFNQDGRSVPNAKIELARILGDGSVKKMDGRVSTETGSFVFRLTPEVARYRVTAKLGGGDPVSKDVEIDGPAVYRVALSINTPAK